MDAGIGYFCKKREKKCRQTGTNLLPMCCEVTVKENAKAEKVVNSI